MRGICIDTGSTTVLNEGSKYFLFEHSRNNYLVSKFNNPGAHMGSYQHKHFKLIEDPQKEQPEQIKLKRFIARVAKYRSGYYLDDLYIITEKSENGYYHVYLKDRPAGSPIGSYITEFFEIVTEYDEIKTARIVKRQERPKIEAKAPSVTIALSKPIEAKNKQTTQPKKSKQVKQAIPDGQMDIFEFLEV